MQTRSAPSPTAPVVGTLELGSDVLTGPEELPGWFPIVREWVEEDGSRFTRNLAFVSAADITFTDPRRVSVAQTPGPAPLLASERLVPGERFIAQIPPGAIATTLGTAPDPTMLGTPQSFVTVRTQPRSGIAIRGSVIARHEATSQEVAIPDGYVITDPRRVTATPERVGIQFSLSDWLMRGRTLNTDAIVFDKQLPASSPTRSSFVGWYESWKPFYEKYIACSLVSPACSLAQSNVSLNYEEFDQALIRYKMQFDAIVSGKFQPTPDRPDTGHDRAGSGLPWWFWLSTGVALVGGGYLVYTKYQEGRAKLAYLDRHAPDIIDRFVPGGQGRAIAEYGRAGRGGRK